jgi:hypothetical protein
LRFGVHVAVEGVRGQVEAGGVAVEVVVGRNRRHFSRLFAVVLLFDVVAAVAFDEAVAALLDYAVLLVVRVVLIRTRTGTPGTARRTTLAVILARTRPLEFLLVVDALLADRIVRGGESAVAPVVVQLLEEVLHALPLLLDAVQGGAVLALESVPADARCLQGLDVLLLQLVGDGVFGVGFAAVARFPGRVVVAVVDEGQRADGSAPDLAVVGLEGGAGGGRRVGTVFVGGLDGHPLQGLEPTVSTEKDARFAGTNLALLEELLVAGLFSRSDEILQVGGVILEEVSAGVEQQEAPRAVVQPLSRLLQSLPEGLHLHLEVPGRVLQALVLVVEVSHGGRLLLVLFFGIVDVLAFFEQVAGLLELSLQRKER